MKKIIVAVAALAMLTGSAYAADWNFYGSARVHTFWADTDVIDGASGDTNVEQALMATSRIGANVKVSDELRGRFEYGAADGNANIRLLYGEWTFGAGSLTIGQDYTPVYICYSNQAYDDDGLGDTGDVYSGREAQIKLKFGEFQIAAVAPNTDVNGATATEVKIPAIEARYTFRFDNVNLRLVGGYNAFSATEAGVEHDIDAYVLGAGIEANLGAVYLAGDIMFGENSGNIIGVDTKSNGANDGIATIVNGQLQDVEVMGFQLVAGYKINDMIAVEAGYGYVEEDLDGTNVDNEASNYYFQVPITLAPGVFVTPEIGVYDYQEAGEADKTYFGAKWQINF